MIRDVSLYRWCVFLGIFMSVPCPAQVTGLWSVEVVSDTLKFNEYWALDFDTDGRFSRYRLTDNRDFPFQMEVGNYSINDELVTLQTDTPVQLGPAEYMLTDEDSLISPINPLLNMTRDQESNWEQLPGSWQYITLSGAVIGNINFSHEGAFSTDISGSQTGHYKTVGSALVLWSTESSNLDLLGEPGLWFNVYISSSELEYRIGQNGFSIRARRDLATGVRGITWGKIKSNHPMGLSSQIIGEKLIWPVKN